MATVKINSEELVPWCERRGLDASEIVAEPPEQWRGKDGIRYRLRRHPVAIGESPFLEVVAPFEDPMPDILQLTGRRA